MVTITRGGYAKRTNTDQYRAQRRGGKGVRGAALRSEDIVDHFFVTSTHNWILFFTNKGRVYRAKGYEFPDAGRDARGQHVANMLAFQPDEQIAEVLTLRDYTVAPYLVLATRSGLVKKSRLSEYDSPRTAGLIAINLREDDEVIGAALVSPEEDLLLVSKGAQAIRFHADDEQMRPTGRATSGVIGMRFNDGDELLGMYVVREAEDVLVATEGGYAKRTPADQYPLRNRGGLGVITAQITEGRGGLVGALMVRPDDEVFAITSNGGVIRTRASEVRQTGRVTMGVRLMNLASGAPWSRWRATPSPQSRTRWPMTAPVTDDSAADVENTASNLRTLPTMATNRVTSTSDLCRIVSARRHKGAPLGTEEDGVDEAGSTTQSPFITTPQLLDSDPDVDGDGAVIDNSSMSSSRTRSGSSRSGSTGAGASRTQATPRADANGTTAKDDAQERGRGRAGQRGG